MEKVQYSRAASGVADDNTQGGAAPRRKMAEADGSLVTATMLETTNINIQNPEHSRIATAILRKKPTMKTKNELIFLQEAFHGIDFFERMRAELKPEDFLLLMRQLKFETVEAGEALFNVGDWGEHFYIIISGAVYILLKKHQEIAKESDQQKTQENAKDKEKNANSDADEKRVFTDGMSDEEKLQIIMNLYPGYFLGRIMQTGSSFGEIALQNRTRRTATVVCKERTVFGTLNREDYNRILFRIYKSRDEENLEFLRTFNLFAHLPNSRLNEIYLQLQKKTFMKNYVFYKEGQKADNIYFIISGEVELSKAIQIGETPESEEPEDPSSRQLMRKLFMRNSDHHSKVKRVRYALLLRGTYFGMEELFTQTPRTSTAVVCSSNCEVFTISHEVFKRLVTDHELIKTAKQNIEKRSWMVNRMSSNVAKVDEVFSKDVTTPTYSPQVKTSTPKSMDAFSSSKETVTTPAKTREKTIFTTTEAAGFLRSIYIHPTPEESTRKKLTIKAVSSDPRSLLSPGGINNQKNFNFPQKQEEIRPLSRKLRTQNISMKGLPIRLIKSNPETFGEKLKEEAEKSKERAQKNRFSRQRLQTAPMKRASPGSIKELEHAFPEDPYKSPRARSHKSIDLSTFPALRHDDSPKPSIKSPINKDTLIHQQRTRPATFQNIPTSPKAGQLGLENENDKQFTTICKALKIDKLFTKERGTIGNAVSHARSNSFHYLFNQESSYMHKSPNKEKSEVPMSLGTFIYNNGFAKIQSPKSTKAAYLLDGRFTQFLTAKKQ